MLQTVWTSIDSAYKRIMRLFADPKDSDERRLQKNVIVTASLVAVLVSPFDISTYFAFDEPLAAVVAIVAVAFIILNLVIYLLFRRYQVLYIGTLLMFMLLPPAVSLALGGLANSSAMLIAPFFPALIALLGDDPKKATPWFVGFVLILLASAFLEPYVARPSNLPLDKIAFEYVENLGIIMALTFFFTRYFIGQKNTAYRLLAVEQEKSEGLLLNILPKEIAQILKVESGIIADHFEDASVLFADLVGFTPMSAQMEPAEMVRLLNEIFSYFDSLVDKYGLEKIRTIGDNYMVASGVPRPRKDHAQLLASFALEMLAYAEQFPAQNGNPVDFRIGINSGPLVAGIIGQRKFQYDVWGDTVNTASRMESHGVAGKIQLTRTSYDLLKDSFICEPRGNIVVKGKGEMDTWYLLGNRTDGQ